MKRRDKNRIKRREEKEAEEAKKGEKVRRQE